MPQPVVCVSLRSAISQGCTTNAGRMLVQKGPLVASESLGQKQEQFALLLAQFIVKLYALGYHVRFGEVFRTPEQAALNAKLGSGIKNSLHCLKLAADLNIFKDGVWLSDTEDLTAVGELWESMGGTWGGRFGKPDGNHFSLEHNGVK